VYILESTVACNDIMGHDFIHALRSNPILCFSSLFLLIIIKVVGLVLEEDDISDTVLESQRLAMQQGNQKGNSSSSVTFTRKSVVRVKVGA